MKRLYTYLLLGLCLILFSQCNSLDLEPVSSISDNKFWKSEAHFTAFNNGLHGLLREKSYNFFMLGEPRADIYNDHPFGGEATQGTEILILNLLNRENAGISNYADLYKTINQLNLMIAKTKATTVLPEATKSYYLGEAYGMRAFVYFHLLRSWGDVIITTDYTDGNSIDLGNLNKAVSPSADVMKQIKQDIQDSESAFGDNFSFKYGKHYWSKAATMMLKGEVYLWSGRQMGGGENDYRTAKAALESVKTSEVASLLDDFSKVFSYSNKKNAEIIFTMHSQKDEYDMLGGYYKSKMQPQQLYMSTAYCDINGVSFKNLPEGQINGLIQYQIQYDLYQKLFLDSDKRKVASMTPVYRKEADGTINYVAPFANKFQGTMLEGTSTRSFLDDYPIYRYADCLLMLAEAKIFLNENPADEINAVRARAYGKEYFEANRATLAYPNDRGSFYDGNKYVNGDEDPILAVLKERMREFLFEGKRWYDLRLMGSEYATKYSLAKADRLLWPIDANTLTNNSLLTQTPGFE